MSDEQKLEIKKQINYWDEVIRRNPNDIMWLYNAYFYRGDLKRQLGFYGEAVADTNRANKIEYLLKGQDSFKKREKLHILTHNENIKKYDNQLHSNSKNSKTFFLRGSSRLCGRNDLIGALNDIDQALIIDDQNLFAYYERANIKYILKDYVGVIDDLDKAIAIKQDSFAYTMRGNAKLELNLLQDALSDYNAAIKISHDYKEAYLNRSIVKSRLSDFDGALDDYYEAVNSGIFKPLKYFSYGDKKLEKIALMYLDKAQPTSHRAYLKRVRESIKHYNKGIEKIQTNDALNAIFDFNQAILLKPEFPAVYINRANAKFILDDIEGAMADYGKALELYPENYLTYLYRGMAKQDLNDLKGAFADFNAAIKLNPNLPIAYIYRALINNKLNQLESVIQDYKPSSQISDQYSAKKDQGNITQNLNELINEIITSDVNPGILRINNLRHAQINHKQAMEKINEGKLQESLAQLIEALKNNPKYNEAHTSYKIVSGRLNDEKNNAERYKAELTDDEIDQYLQQNVQSLNCINNSEYGKETPDWTDWYTYKHFLCVIDPLEKLAKNRYILSLLIHILPETVSQNKYDDCELPKVRKLIYDKLVEYWFTDMANEISRDTDGKDKIFWSNDVLNQAKQKLTKEELQTAKNNFLKLCLKRYHTNLAKHILKLGKGNLDFPLTDENTTKPELLYPNEGKTAYFRSPIDDDVMETIRSCSMLTLKNDGYHFIDKSLIEYFLKGKLIPNHKVISQSYRSAINPKLYVDYDHWVVSLVRDTMAYFNTHVFMIVEGINGYGQFVLHRYELSKVKGEEQIEPDKAAIIIAPKIKGDAAKYFETITNLICNGEEHDRRRGAPSLFGKSWRITREQAKDLHRFVLEDEKRHVNFRFLYGSMAIRNGDKNCFTWARKKLLKIGNSDINTFLHKGEKEHLFNHTKLELVKPPDKNDDEENNNFLTRLLSK